MVICVPIREGRCGFLRAPDPYVKHLIQEAESRLRRRGAKVQTHRVWTAHIRYAALAERGGGRITIAKLPLRLVAPHGPPPAEAYDELKEAGILERCGPKCTLFTDGAHAWPKLVQHHNRVAKSRIQVKQVAHYLAEYTKSVPKTRKGQSGIAGTQSLDQRWRWLKAYIPHSIKARQGRKDNPSLDNYVFSYQFRANTRASGRDLWGAVGNLVRRKITTKAKTAKAKK